MDSNRRNGGNFWNDRYFRLINDELNLIIYDEEWNFDNRATWREKVLDDFETKQTYGRWVVVYAVIDGNNFLELPQGIVKMIEA